MQDAQPLQPDPLTTTVPANGVRLDRFVADWRGLSRAAALRLLDQGALACNGRVVGRGNKGDLLSVGDQVSLSDVYASGEVPLADEPFSLTVLAEGNGWLVVDKPAGTPVRPHTLDEKGTILNAVVARDAQVIGVGEGGLRSGIVHRLDTDTSGCLIIATQQDAWVMLRAAFASHHIQKRYLALVHGVPNEVGDIQRDLRVATHQPARVQVEKKGQGGQRARTCSLGWRMVERFGDRASLIELDLHTGFLHQVRAMMSDLGHPVVGDPLYGDAASTLQAPRQMLHAKSLAYDELKAEAPMPDDLQRVLQSLRGK